MCASQLLSRTIRGVTLLGDTSCPCGVTFAFTERGGGVSGGPYASLNLGDACGDDPSLVETNRRLALEAAGMGGLERRLVNPVQVHGSDVVVIADGHESPESAARLVREGADGVVCAEPDVPVLLCSADCVLVVLVAPMRGDAETRGAFAVIHSGWRGTEARICAKALSALVEVAHCDARDVCAYVGPHIGRDDYEVSEELAARFSSSFGEDVCSGRNLDLGLCVRRTLEGEGVPPASIECVGVSTAGETDRFFSFRTAKGCCGRQGALACLRASDQAQDE